jgi:hypothetical protein
MVDSRRRHWRSDVGLAKSNDRKKAIYSPCSTDEHGTARISGPEVGDFVKSPGLPDHPEWEDDPVLEFRLPKRERRLGVRGTRSTAQGERHRTAGGGMTIVLERVREAG